VERGIVRANVDVFKQFFGDDLTGLERRLVLYLRKLPYTDPFLGMPHFVATITLNAGRRPRREATTFHSAVLAKKWLEETLEKVPEAQRAAAETAIRTFNNRSLAEAFAAQWLRSR
jgi:hypothetical protein